jgi:hypothetical protein
MEGNSLVALVLMGMGVALGYGNLYRKAQLEELKGIAQRIIGRVVRINLNKSV